MSLLPQSAAAQCRRSATHASVCANPTVPCKTSATSQPDDLPFLVPQNAVILDPELFCAIIPKTADRDDNDRVPFLSDNERLRAGFNGT